MALKRCAQCGGGPHADTATICGRCGTNYPQMVDLADLEPKLRYAGWTRRDRPGRLPTWDPPTKDEIAAKDH